jgi:hypothetical protein
MWMYMTTLCHGLLTCTDWLHAVHVVCWVVRCWIRCSLL